MGLFSWMDKALADKQYPVPTKKEISVHSEEYLAFAQKCKAMYNVHLYDEAARRGWNAVYVHMYDRRTISRPSMAAIVCMLTQREEKEYWGKVFDIQEEMAKHEIVLDNQRVKHSRIQALVDAAPYSSDKGEL